MTGQDADPVKRLTRWGSNETQPSMSSATRCGWSTCT